MFEVLKNNCHDPLEDLYGLFLVRRLVLQLEIAEAAAPLQMRTEASTIYRQGRECTIAPVGASGCKCHSEAYGGVDLLLWS